MLTVSPRQALLQAGDLDSCCEPAGSEAAKFRLWVKSKGLSLTRPGAGAEEGQEGDRADSPVLYVPTGTDKVSPSSCRPPSCLEETNMSSCINNQHRWIDWIPDI